MITLKAISPNSKWPRAYCNNDSNYTVGDVAVDMYNNIIVAAFTNRYLYRNQSDAKLSYFYNVDKDGETNIVRSTYGSANATVWGNYPKTVVDSHNAIHFFYMTSDSGSVYYHKICTNGVWSSGENLTAPVYTVQSTFSSNSIERLNKFVIDSNDTIHCLALTYNSTLGNGQQIEYCSLPYGGTWGSWEIVKDYTGIYGCNSIDMDIDFYNTLHVCYSTKPNDFYQYTYYSYKQSGGSWITPELAYGTSYVFGGHTSEITCTTDGMIHIVVLWSWVYTSAYWGVVYLKRAVSPPYTWTATGLYSGTNYGRSDPFTSKTAISRSYALYSDYITYIESVYIFWNEDNNLYFRQYDCLTGILGAKTLVFPTTFLSSGAWESFRILKQTFPWCAVNNVIAPGLLATGTGIPSRGALGAIYDDDGGGMYLWYADDMYSMNYGPFALPGTGETPYRDKEHALKMYTTNSYV